MPALDRAASLADATEYTSVLQILREKPHYAFKLREAQSIILQNRAVPPPPETPYIPPLSRRRGPSLLPYRPQLRQRTRTLPQQLNESQLVPKSSPKETQTALVQEAVLTDETPPPVVDTPRIDSLPPSRSTETGSSSADSADASIENQIQSERSPSPEDVSDCERTRQVDRAYFNRKNQNSDGNTGAENTPSSDAESSSSVGNQPQNERENVRFELVHPVPLWNYGSHEADRICDSCVLRPSSLIRPFFNLRVTPRHIMKFYSQPNHPWAPPSLIKINQQPNVVTHEGAPQAWDLTFLELMPHQINLSLMTLRQICDYDPERSAFSVVRRTTEELFQQEFFNFCSQFIGNEQ